MPESTLVPRPIAVWKIAVALAVGLVLYLLAGNDINLLRAIVVGCAVIVSLVSFVNSGLAKGLDRVRNPTPGAARMIALGTGILGALYLFTSAKLQDRALFPKMEDECSYGISTQLLAHGRLWLPAHPMADFFESLFLIVKPVYCSVYFPGTAIFFAPRVWLHLHTWVLPLVVAGLIIVMLYRVITTLLDGVAGLLACFWFIALEQVRTFSVMITSHLPMLLLGLLMVWAWLHWREQGRMRWALLIGLFSGWAAITRPADAIAYALPIGIAMLIDLWKQPRSKMVMAGVAIVLGAAPFLALQIVFDIGVTGKPFLTPYTYSLQQDQPGAEFGFHTYDSARRPATAHPGKQQYFTWCQTFFEQHQFPRILKRWVSAENQEGGIHNAYPVVIADNTLPSRLLLILIPAGLLGLRLGDRRAQVLLGTFFAFCAIYFFNPFFLAHYQMVVIPAAALCALRGARAAVGQRYARQLGVPVTVAILALSLTSLWEFKALSFSADDFAIQDAKEGMLESSRLSIALSQLPEAVKGTRAVVLFGPDTSSFFQEPVYNPDVANIDNAPIIRAHDLGVRNAELIRYYAEHQPDRVFYICNLNGPSGPIIDRLGTIPELLGMLSRGEALHTLVQPSAPARP